MKTAFCEYWTSINIKISITCVYKEHEIKTKMVQEQWLQIKMKLTWKMLFSAREINLWWEEKKFGGGSLMRGIFLGLGEMNKFWLLQGACPHRPRPSIENLFTLLILFPPKNIKICDLNFG